MVFESMSFNYAFALFKPFPKFGQGNKNFKTSILNFGKVYRIPRN
jgi:hypothetical protein